MKLTDDIIANMTEELFASEASPEPQEAPSGPKPIDYYQAQQNAAYTASQKPTAYGSPAQIMPVVSQMVEEFKETSYNINKKQYDHLLDAEAKDQAEYLRQNYMTTQALPMVESLVEMYGADALINNNKALAKLDEVMLSPNGTGDGFTKGYLKQMHYQQRGEAPSYSDAEVRNGISKIKQMANNDDIRGSVNKAQRLKQRIDNGELSSSEDDYALLLQVASYK